MNKIMHEVDFYPEILSFFSEQFEANLSVSGKNIKFYSGIGNLNTALKSIVSDNKITIPSIVEFSRKANPLLLDIFFVFTDGINFKMVILEVKHKKVAGLTCLSQLIGYCIVSDCEYGLLINVDGKDGGASDPLTNIMNTDKNTSLIKREKNDGTKIDTQLGVMNWNSKTKNIEYTNLGEIKSISKLCELIVSSFDEE